MIVAACHVRRSRYEQHFRCLVLHQFEHGVFRLVHFAMWIVHNYRECRADNDDGRRRGRLSPIWMDTIGVADCAAAVGHWGSRLHDQ
jgi:hypothetical protein